MSRIRDLIRNEEGERRNAWMIRAKIAGMIGAIVAALIGAATGFMAVYRK